MAIAVQMNDKMVEALKAYADTNKTTVSDIARKAIANVIGFDLASIPTVVRTKYATKEERDAAMKKAAKDRRDLDTQILKAVSEGRMNDAKRLMNDKTKKTVKASKKAGEVKTVTPATK